MPTLRSTSSRLRRIVFGAAALAAAAALAGCGTQSGAAGPSADSGGDSDAPRVAALFTQFVDQGNWDPAGYAAYQDMYDTYGFDCTYIEEATDALQYVGQTIVGDAVPPALFLMAPYLLALVVWLLMSGKVRGPRDLGLPLLR